MEIAKEHLDTSISQLVEGATNTETLREFIRNTEKEFNIHPAAHNYLIVFGSGRREGKQKSTG